MNGWMIASAVVGWLAIGYLTFLLACYIIGGGMLTRRDLFVAGIASLIGPVNLFHILFWSVFQRKSEWLDQPITRARK